MTRLKAGVVGAGVFGGHHARKYLAEPRTELVALYDSSSARAAELASSTGAHAADSLADLLTRADVVTIASISSAHAPAVRAALDAGKHVLVEKPLAVDEAEAHALVRLAQEKGVVLACGHQERLVFEAMGLFDANERPTKIECVRAGPWSGRGADVSATLDLMVHDLDLVLQLMGGPPKRVSARGCVEKGETADEMTALLSFADGSAKITASRIAEARTRTMRLVYPSGEVRMDFIARTFENASALKLDANFAETASGRDPLGANVSRFIDAVTGAASRPAVTGAEAAAALALALKIDHAADLPSLAPEDNHAPIH